MKPHIIFWAWINVYIRFFNPSPKFIMLKLKFLTNFFFCRYLFFINFLISSFRSPKVVAFVNGNRSKLNLVANYKKFIIDERWRTPKLLDRFNYESKGKNNKRKRSWAHSLARTTLGVKGGVGASGGGLGRLTSNSITHTNLHKPNNKLVSV
jgi:hypothetical protein